MSRFVHGGLRWAPAGSRKWSDGPAQSRARADHGVPLWARRYPETVSAPLTGYDENTFRMCGRSSVSGSVRFGSSTLVPGPTWMNDDILKTAAEEPSGW